MLKKKTRPSAFGCRKANPLKALWVIFMGLALIMAPGALAAVHASTADPRQAVNKKAIIQQVVKLQIPFIGNQGQIQDERVQFYAQTFDGTFRYELKLPDEEVLRVQPFLALRIRFWVERSFLLTDAKAKRR